MRAETQPWSGARVSAGLACRYVVAGCPAARLLTSAVVSVLPPMPQSPLCTSSMTHHVTDRMFSPSMLTMVSVSFSTISRFWVASNTPSISFTLMNGIAGSPSVASTLDAQSQGVSNTVTAVTPTVTFGAG
jgi:hypothetical protein